MPTLPHSLRLTKLLQDRAQGDHLLARDSDELCQERSAPSSRTSKKTDGIWSPGVKATTESFDMHQNPDQLLFHMATTRTQLRTSKSKSARRSLENDQKAGVTLRVEWSDEDRAFIGYCPELFPYGGVCNAPTRHDCLKILEGIVEEELSEQE